VDEEDLRESFSSYSGLVKRCRTAAKCIAADPYLQCFVDGMGTVLLSVDFHGTNNVD
jgi:hypothetical protein